MSSRQGAAMICTPIGIGSSGTGTATTGRPMNEIGWVWMPILARTGSSTPSSMKLSWPSFGAVQGVAGARITSTDWNSSSTLRAVPAAEFLRLVDIAAPGPWRRRSGGRAPPDRNRSAACAARSRCSEAPSVVVMM